ncbi:MAG TPA: ferrochelatase [Polyangiaceae bacterium]|nr:ferrochelatase [Polyangiaceae bacterium]
MPHGDVLLLGHGTVENLDDLPPFLANIRRGRPAPPELVQELERRYAVIGGSPLLRISRELAAALERAVGARVHLAMRFWHPFAKDVLCALGPSAGRTLRVVPLAPYSGPVYAAEMRSLAEAARAEGLEPPALACAPSWGTEPLLLDAFASQLRATLAFLPEMRREAAQVFFTAHSLPMAVIRQGDPYAEEVHAAAEAVALRVHLKNPWRVVYQSQGATADPWLGPAVRESLQEIAALGSKDVIFCPIGFLSDHIEILYDLDVAARGEAERAGVAFHRTESLNASPALVSAIAAVAARL